jgi:DNA-binding transcriptional LysR family regulator
LLEAGKKILQTCNAVKAELKTITTPNRFRIGVLQSLSSGCVSKLLSAFRRAHVRPAIEVVDGSCEQLVEFLAEQELDTVLTIVGGNDLKFASRVLFEEPYLLAVPKDHRFARRQSLKLADLDGEPFIVRTRCDFYQDVTNVLVARGIKMRVVYQTDHDDRALALVAAGIGLALVPAHFELSAVKQVPALDLGISRAIGLLWSREREHADLKEFIEFAGGHCWAQYRPRAIFQRQDAPWRRAGDPADSPAPFAQAKLNATSATPVLLTLAG